MSRSIGAGDGGRGGSWKGRVRGGRDDASHRTRQHGATSRKRIVKVVAIEEEQS